MKNVRSIATGLVVGPAVAFGILAGGAQAAQASVPTSPTSPTVLAGGDWGGSGYYGRGGGGWGGRGWGGPGYYGRGWGGPGYYGRSHARYGSFADPCRYGYGNQGCYNYINDCGGGIYY